jgi:phage shock protein C
MSLATMSVTGPFRSKKGLLLGVVQGLAEHWGKSPFTLRAMAVLISIFLAFWPMVIIYLAAALIMPSRPAAMPMTERQKELFLLGRSNPRALVELLENRLRQLDWKARRLEDIVTSKSFRARRPF